MRVFGSEDQCPTELEEISEEFIKKFDGMPSTIISIARFLASKTSMKKDEWTALLQFMPLFSADFFLIKLLAMDSNIANIFCLLILNLACCI